MRMYISLTLDEAERLRQMAHQERRRPVDQAAYLVAQALAKWSEDQAPQDREVVYTAIGDNLA